MDGIKVIDNWIKSVEQAVTNVFRDVVIECGGRVIRMSPVDSGLFKGNWQLTIDNEGSSEIQRFDSNGGSTLNDLVSKANLLTAGQVAYILNHIEYGYDLENGTYRGPTAKVTDDGFSRQAPEGMVRVTAREFIPIFEEAVRLNKV